MGEGTVFSTRGVGRLDGHMQEGETEWLTATSFPSLSVLEARSRSPRCGRLGPFWGVSVRICHEPLSQVSAVARSPWHSLGDGCVTPTSASAIAWASSL